LVAELGADIILAAISAPPGYAKNFEAISAPPGCDMN
jgi:hypothetical protein